MTIQNKKLAVYYGWPSSVNATYTVEGAIAVFTQYNTLVLGAGLEATTHPDHENTVNIIAGLPNTHVFGYIDSTTDLADNQTNIDNWLATGVQGIFCDKFGYDFNMTRDGQNSLVDYIHSKNLTVMANAFNPDDAFAPSGNTLTHLTSKDWYFAESYQISNDNYVDTDTWITLSDKIKLYKNAIGINVAGITTTASGIYDQDKFDYAYFSALMYGFDAFGWGELDYSASSAQLPFRPRKGYYGTNIISGIKNEGGKLYVYTNIGFSVNTITKKAENTIKMH